MASAKAARKKWELLKTYCAGESVSSGARRTLGTCPVFAKPVTANFTRSRRFREVPLGGGAWFTDEITRGISLNIAPWRSGER